MNYFQEYPLATKEGSTKYRRRILSELAQNASVERHSLEKSLQEVRRLKKRIGEQGGVNLSAKTDLALLENDLEQLKGNFSSFRAWLAENQVDEMKTDFDQWADFSGFGMSDITFGNIRQNEEKIAQLAQNQDFITTVLQQRKLRLEKRLQDFEKQVKLIEEELKEEQVEVEKENKEEYFKESYFDTTESEVEKEENWQPKPDDSNPKKQNDKNE